MATILNEYSHELESGLDESKEAFARKLQTEAIWKGAEVSGRYPSFVVLFEGRTYSISVVEPFDIAYIDGERVSDASPESILGKITRKKHGRGAGMVDTKAFSKVFVGAYSLVSYVSSGASTVKLSHVLSVVKDVYGNNAPSLDPIRLLEECIEKGTLQAELHPGRDLRDAIPLTIDGVGRNVVWVKIVQ